MSDEVLYAEKKKAYALLKPLGLSLPNNLQSDGSIKSIRDFAFDVNKKGKDISNISVKEQTRDTKY